MSVSSIASSSVVSSLQQARNPVKPEAVEPKRVGPDRDGDADDRVGSASAPKPVVNTSGESTGHIVNDQA